MAQSCSAKQSYRLSEVGRGDIEAALQGAVADTDAALLASACADDAAAHPEPTQWGAKPNVKSESALPDGTTAAWALIWRHELLVAWLGDSRVVLCRWEGASHPVSNPGTPCTAEGSRPGARAGSSCTGCAGRHSPEPVQSNRPGGAATADSSPAPGKSGSRRLTAVALTEDHSPGSPGERARILAAGGSVSTARYGASHLFCLCQHSLLERPASGVLAKISNAVMGNVLHNALLSSSTGYLSHLCCCTMASASVASSNDAAIVALMQSLS